ncbi:MAG: PAS domain S-box protein, partial [SAR324 cluster bacterium]|nr:PAS domain S-box protein [SAR324 cluster bacterium]
MTGRPISILLVEDEHDFAVAFEAILGEIKCEQYDLDHVDTFELARKMISARRHDVYVVDYKLADGDGLELIREATSSGHPGPFIVLTARGNREVDQRAMDAGAADYLDKTVVGKFAFAEGGDVNPGADLLERSIRYAMERARDRAELKASETQFRSLIEGSIQGINVVKDGVMVFANQAMADIFGYAGTQDIVGTQINDRIAPEEHERLLAFREARLRGEDTPAQYEFRGIRKDGKYIWVQVFAHSITWEDEPAILVTLIDITARKQAEEALRESQERFYQMAENIPATVFEFVRSSDGSYRAPYINRIGVDYMGLTSDELETLPDSAAPIFERMHPDDQDSFLKALGNSNQSMTRFDWQGRGKHASGDWHWLHGFASPRKLENGEVMWNGVILDIHKQRQDQEALRQSEARLRSVIEGSIQGINVLKDGVTVFANQAMADIFGYAGPQEIIGTQPIDRIAPEERERILAIREARLRGEDAPTQYEYRGIRKDGTYIWVQIFVNTITWEDEPATLVTLIDITARNRAENALRDSERRYRELIEYSLQGVSVNRDGKFLFCSQAMARMFGIDDPQTMVDRDVDSFYTAESNARRIERRANVLKDGTLVPAQLEAVRPDGARFWVESFTRKVDWQGAPAYFSVHVDITERKRAEEALKKSESHLASILDTAGDGIVTMDDACIVQSFNKAAEHI